MAGNHTNLDGEAKPCVEPAPDIDLSVWFNGQLLRATVRAGETETLDFGTFPVKVRVDRVKRRRVRPAGKPPYHWIIKTESWSDKIRAMSEENARRLFYQRFGTDEDILEIYPEIA